MSRILVTGGSGLVGHALQHICKSYPDNDFTFLSRTQVDLLNEQKTIDFFVNHKFDYVIHLAANVGGLYKNMKEPVNLLEDNLRINSNVLKAAHIANVKKVVACLSTCIFPDIIEYPLCEEDLHDGPPHFSNQAYAYAKRLLAVQCASYNQQYNENFVCVIPTNIYGPHDNFHIHDAHVIPALIHKCYLAKRNGEKFTVCGSGRPLRQFLFSHDFARCLMEILFHYNEKSPVIVSVDQVDEISIHSVASMIARSFDYQHMLEFDTTYSDGQYKKTASNKKFRTLFPHFVFTSLRDGLHETIQWFLAHTDTLRK